jgi:radical SAM superfamily enzyme YgiQ (UPF0313 family)
VNPIKHSITWEERQKARQRLDAETGTIIKDWGGKLPFAFVYPNTYHIGMSNLGLQAIYGLVNSREEAVCERVFWDNENSQKGVLPLSVESQRPLADFSVLAFSLNYEIDYINIAPVLRASGLPLYSADRDETYSLVIAGGPCITANPMPVAPFFDCLCIGEAEALLPPMLLILAEGISERRDDLLKELSAVPGLYVPRYNSGTPVVRQRVKDLDDFPVHSIVLTRDTELSDLFLVEVERGCAHGCRFCLVSSAFSPPRFHSLEQLVQQARAGLSYRKRLGLVGPAVTDHPQIEDLLDRILAMGLQFSVSSSRITSLTPRILEQMVKGGLRSIALAPEAGSECMRRVIKKGITGEQVLEAISQASEKGMQQLKLYFMLGLPGETEADIQAIVDLTLAGKEIIDRKRGKTRLTLNIAPFVPKAGTPFQWQPMAPLDVLQRRLDFLKGRLTPKGIQIKSESPQWSEVQAVLARGDGGLARVLAELEKQSLPAWRQAIEKHQIDIDYYAHQKWNPSREPPWATIKSDSKPERWEKNAQLSNAHPDIG